MAEKMRDEWELADLVIEHSRRVLLCGLPGTGKTTAAHRAARRMGKRIYAIPLTEETSMAELRGHKELREGGTVWSDGPALMAWRDPKGAVLVLDEIDQASGDVLTFCHTLLDDPDIAQLTLPTGVTVKPSKGFQVVATMNGNPDELPAALRDRFPVCIEITKAHPEAILALPEDLRNAAAGTVTAMEGERRISIRAWYEFAALRSVLGVEDAALAVFGPTRCSEVINALKIAKKATK